MPAHHLLSSHVECVRGRSSKDELRWTLKFKFETWLERSCRALESESEVAHSCLTLCDPMDCSLPGSSVHGIFQAIVDTGVDCHFLLQGIFKTQGLNPGLPHCRQMLYHLSHQGSCRALEWHTIHDVDGICQ